MRSSITRYCCPHHRFLRSQLRAKIRTLEHGRRGLHTAPAQDTVNTSKSLKATGSSPPLTTPPSKSLYFDTVPPTNHQIEAAKTFFNIYKPRKSWVATEWRKHGHPERSSSRQARTHDEPVSPGLVPEIAFLGRSNAGKSSLLNALLQSPSLCRVGPKPGKTTAMHAWTLASTDPVTGGATRGNKGDMDPKLTVLDMPGYGHGSREEWGSEIVTYLTRRKQLRRAMLLVNPAHGLKSGDQMMLDMMRENGIVHQIVACKCDAVRPSELADLLMKLREEIKADESKTGSVTRLCLDDIIAVGQLGDGKMNKNMESVQRKQMGLGDLRWTVLRACGLETFALSVHDSRS